MNFPPRPTFLDQRQYDAFVADDATPDSIRVEILKAAAGTFTGNEAEQAFDEACAQHRFQGAAVSDIAAEEIVGHLIFGAALLRRLAELLNEYDADRADSLLSMLGGREFAEESIQVVHQLIDADEYLSEWIRSYPDGEPRVLWLFRRTDLEFGHNPFESIADGCLPWRMGLPYLEQGNAQYIGLALNGQMIAPPVRLPRAPDAGYECLKYWWPGGLCVPREDAPPACAGDTGFPEVLALSPSFDAIVKPVFTIRTTR